MRINESEYATIIKLANEKLKVNPYDRDIKNLIKNLTEKEEKNTKKKQ